MANDSRPRLIETINDQLAEVVAAVRRSLVQVHSGSWGNGAGTMLHADGLIVTSAHVVQRRSPRLTLADGRTMPGRLLAYDEQLDLAVVAVEATNLPTIPLGDRKQLRAGQMVIALGHPWGIIGATTAGMVIAVGRPLEGVPYDGEMIQVGCSLRPGYSGGPMVDGQGKLVGINTMISGPKVGMAVPVQVIKRFLKQALGSRPAQAVRV